jgi:hypothetical protein
MTALTSQAITLAGIVPSAVAVSASDTIARAQFGALGVIVRVINGGGSPDICTIVDPTLTALGSAATNPTVTIANGTSKEFFVPTSAINASDQATLQHSFLTTVTCEVKRI